MANKRENLNGSQFYITLRDAISYLDKKHTVFGQVTEGLEVLEKINEVGRSSLFPPFQAFCNEKFRPYVDIRILHTHILYDPYDDPVGLKIPDASPQQ